MILGLITFIEKFYIVWFHCIFKRGDRLRELLEKFPEQLNEAMYIGKNIKLKGDFKNILVSGMGGSAIPGDILNDYIGEDVPIYVNRGYDIPHWINKSTLAFVISYSGNTEETLDSLSKLRKKHISVVIITSGGKLKGIAEDDNIPLIEIPTGLPPRSAIAYLLIPMLNVLANCKLISDPTSDIKKSINGLKKFGPGLAHGIALDFYKKLPIIYASDKYKGLVTRWKNQFNEDSKVLALGNVFSELDHNEIEGYSKMSANYKVLVIRDKEDYLRIKKRMKITENIIGRKNVDELWLQGKSKIEKLLYGIHVGDWVSYYLAELEGIDPLEVHKIDYLKSQL